MLLLCLFELIKICQVSYNSMSNVTYNESDQITVSMN